MSMTTAISYPLFSWNVYINVPVTPPRKQSKTLRGQLGAPIKPKRSVVDENVSISVPATPSSPVLKHHVGNGTSLKRTRTLSGRMAKAHKPRSRVRDENLPVVKPTVTTLKRTRTLSGRMAKEHKPTFGSRTCDNALPALWLAAADGARLGCMGGCY